MQIKLFSRLFFLFYALILILVISGPLKAQSSSKPNIVFILTDDQAWYTIHALGNNEIETPNLDRLASMGRSFTNAYNMGAWGGAVCVTSRAMFISGRTIWRAKELESKWKQGQAINQTWGKIMQQGGYVTFMTGKWHVEAPANEIFDVATDIRPGMPEYKTPANAKLPGYATNKGLNKPGYNRPLSINDDTWLPYDTSFGGYWTGGTHWSVAFKNHSIDHIRAAAKQDKPFFLYLASNAPHDPRQSPKEYVDRYPLDKISMPKNFLSINPYKDSIGNSASLRDEALAPFPRTELAIKTHTKEYYAAITFLDKQIGEVLDALEATGKMDNTYIFFTSDHGLAMGRHGFMGKQTLFEHSMKPPLIVVGPGVPKNTICKTPVYIQDIVATSIELAQVKKPAFVEFESFLSLAKGSSRKEIHEGIYGAYMNVQRSIRKGQYKLIVLPKLNKVLLFDLNNDPEEMQDLAGAKKYKSTVSKLFKKLLEKQKQMGDQLNISEIANKL